MHYIFQKEKKIFSTHPQKFSIINNISNSVNNILYFLCYLILIIGIIVARKNMIPKKKRKEKIIFTIFNKFLDQKPLVPTSSSII